MTHMPRELTIAEDNIGFLFPHRKDEEWKWTDVRAAIKSDAECLFGGSLPKIVSPSGVSVVEVNIEGPERNGVKGPMIGAANYLASKRWAISVPKGFSSKEELSIQNLSEGSHFIDIELFEDSNLDMIEYLSGESGKVSNAFVRIKLHKGATMNRTIIHDDPVDHVRVYTTHITAWKGANIVQHALSFGGALSRLETRIAGMGKEIEATLNGAYLLGGKRHVDMTSYIDLSVPDCTIRQAVKGVVTDNARGVFQGKFHVRKPAQQTDAEMRHDALMLSDTCEIRSKPELEIYADDVACAHGNTIGQLDENALFYMRQRGIPAAEARALLTEAFVADAFDDMNDETLRDSLLSKIRDWLKETK